MLPTGCHKPAGELAQPFFIGLAADYRGQHDNDALKIAHFRWCTLRLRAPTFWSVFSTSRSEHQARNLIPSAEVCAIDGPFHQHRERNGKESHLPYEISTHQPSRTPR